MKQLVLLALAGSLCSCGLAGRLLEAPVRLMEAGVRTVSDVNDTTTPATREASATIGVALEVTEEASKVKD